MTTNATTTHTGLETLSGKHVGRDPRRMEAAELEALGHFPVPLTDIMRTHCIDCAGGETAEARKCVRVACGLWPYRMGTNPLRRRNLSEEQREAQRARMSAVRASANTRSA